MYEYDSQHTGCYESEDDYLFDTIGHSIYTWICICLTSMARAASGAIRYDTRPRQKTKENPCTLQSIIRCGEQGELGMSIR